MKNKNTNVQTKDLTGTKCIFLIKLKKDLVQNAYNLDKIGLYNGLLKDGVENLLEILRDYDV